MKMKNEIKKKDKWGKAKVFLFIFGIIIIGLSVTDAFLPQEGKFIKFPQFLTGVIAQVQDNSSGTFIGESGTEITWVINQTGLEEELEVDYEFINETATRFNIIVPDNYKTELQKINRSVKDIPLEKTKLNEDFTISNVNKSDDISFIVYYSQLKDGMEFKLGWESIQISTEASTIASAYTHNENICITPDGVIHTAWEGDVSNLWYANSTDNGGTWTSREIYNATIIIAGITCSPNGNLTVSYIEGTDLDMFTSSNGGASFDGPITVEDDTGSFSGPYGNAVDSNNVVHWCLIDNGDDLIYVNSSNLDQGIEISSADSDHCDIEINSTGAVIVVVSEGATDDLDIMFNSGTGWSSRLSIDDDLGNVASALYRGLEIAIDNDDEIHIASMHSADLNYCNGTIASGWTCIEPIGAGTDDSPEIAVTEEDDIFISYQTATTESGDIIMLNSSNGTGFQNLGQLQAEASGGWLSIAQSRYATSNNITETMHFVYTSSSNFYYDNLTVPTPAPPPVIDLNITFPTTSSTLATNNNTNETLTFNITSDGTPITTGVTMENITIDGNYATILTTGGGEETTMILLDTADTEILEDTRVDPDFPDTNYGSDDNLQTSADASNPAYYHSFIKFNNMSDPISTGDTINTAILSIYIQFESCSATCNLDVQHLYNNYTFDEAVVTYNLRPTADSEYNSTVENSADANIGTGRVNISVAQAVQRVVDAGESNVSFRLSVNNPSAFSYFEMTSKEGATATNRPRLFINYTSDAETQEFEHNGTSWVVNVTTPDIVNGTYDLFLNATHDGTTYNDTQTSSVIYGTVPDTCSPSSPLSSNYEFTCSDNCTQSTNLDAGGFNITFSNDNGHFIVQSNITNFDKIIRYPICEIRIYSDGGFNK